jgi:hypothetical protein
MPIFFSTLEDAWGRNDYPIEKQQKTSNNTKNPLCELYGKRYSKISKPILENEDNISINFAKYDENEILPNTHQLQHQPVQQTPSKKINNYYPIELDEYSDFASIKAIDNEDDDKYLNNALKKHNIIDTPKNIVQEDIEEDNEDNDDSNNNQNQLTIKPENDDNYLDLGLFVTSGIIIIFMMEKILQLGMLIGQK